MSTPVAETEGSAAEEAPVLSVRNLRTVFHTDRETIRAVDGVDLDIHRGETVGLVGESGSGKSVTARSIMGLVDEPGEVLPGSSITFEGRELADLTDKQYQEVRGSGIGMIFQDPLKALNPVFTVGNQIKEALRVNRGITGSEATEEAIDLLEAVSIPDPARRLKEYPHQFSGGMQQRAIIAMMLACDPEVLICDEPTTALDVTIQAQILELLKDLQEERGLALLFITHDMGVIAEMADNVNVMYAGEIVEKAPVDELFDSPKHPYTRGLLEAIPGTQEDADRLRSIEGDVPTPNEAATYCRFAPRCPEAFDDCEKIHPELVGPSEAETDRSVACLLYPDDRPQADAVEFHESLSAPEEGAGTLSNGAEDGGDRT
jgi:peptide/nickel transport system ATP-binding protein